MSNTQTKTTKSIVVVADHADLRSFLTAALEGAGYEVRSATEGGQALDLLRERTADLLITDIFMPGREGFQTISSCRAEFPQIRIVVVSAGTILGLNHDFLSTAGLLKVGATLRKPFTGEQLLDTVQRVLR